MKTIRQVISELTIIAGQTKNGYDMEVMILNPQKLLDFPIDEITVEWEDNNKSKQIIVRIQ